ncbi:MAG: hypothetical protein ABIT83_00980 [Massilia sp.]
MFRPRRLVRIFAAALAFVCGALFILATLSATELRHLLEHDLDGVDASDGISGHEAEQIAQAYFSGFVSGCGGIDQAALVNDEWLVPASFGFAGRPMAPIRISAKNGAVSQLGGPSFRSYRSFRSILLWGIPIKQLEDRVHDYYLDKWAVSEE